VAVRRGGVGKDKKTAAWDKIVPKKNKWLRGGDHGGTTKGKKPKSCVVPEREEQKQSNKTPRKKTKGPKGGPQLKIN